jgi:zinc transport system ATP-binding protein
MSANNRKPPVLEFDDVCFAYEREEVLHNVDFKVEKGDLVAVVGPNGGGKSTLIRLALGLLQPLRGTVRAFGEAPAASRRLVGYAPQHLQFDPAFPVTALDVVLMGRVERRAFGPYRREDKKAANEALARVRLEQLGDRAFSSLSGGERQRVLIAQALVSAPELLLLDEPTANVDSAVEHEIYELLHELNANVTIVLVSHNLNVVTRHASHVACVNRTASVMPVSQMTDDHLHSIYRGDIAVLQHNDTCHVIDPTSAMQTPHRHDTASPGGQA